MCKLVEGMEEKDIPFLMDILRAAQTETDINLNSLMGDNDLCEIAEKVYLSNEMDNEMAGCLIIGHP